MSDKTDQLPQLPQGLRTELHVVSNKGMTGNKTWVLRDLGTGLGHTSSEWIRYCRPQWFKPKNGQ
ncbi:DUF5440 family protein [Pseudomonas brenneri]|uniref:DUF5440 family protein n=1 Tax=Pseudomonas brenneri TaxID=129817 RepID=UPI003B9FE8F6